MIRQIERFADRMLAKLAPQTSASAVEKCECHCSDACFYCCPRADGTFKCSVASGSQCM